MPSAGHHGRSGARAALDGSPRQELSATEPEPEPSPARPLTIEVVHVDGDWASFGDIDALIHAAAAALASHQAVSEHLPAAACVALSSNAAVRRLNSNYRRKDKPTNVLSFPASAQAQPTSSDEPSALGDVVLADGVIMAEAAELAISPSHHLQHLVIYGLLHLMGHDHETDDEAAIMEGLETEILAGLGIADPYRLSE